jgi:hypothetical protein
MIPRLDPFHLIAACGVVDIHRLFMRRQSQSRVPQTRRLGLHSEVTRCLLCPPVHVQITKRAKDRTREGQGLTWHAYRAAGCIIEYVTCNHLWADRLNGSLPMGGVARFSPDDPKYQRTSLRRARQTYSGTDSEKIHEHRNQVCAGGRVTRGSRVQQLAWLKVGLDVPQILYEVLHLDMTSVTVFSIVCIEQFLQLAAHR